MCIAAFFFRAQGRMLPRNPTRVEVTQLDLELIERIEKNNKTKTEKPLGKRYLRSGVAREDTSRLTTAQRIGLEEPHQ